VIVAAGYDNWVGLGIGLALVALLAIALIAPDRF
jgi:hypothetical protein